ncbi:MAG: TlpA family protein disulfide reductase [Acidimicrobiia bacterium]|nr:TlpA family protein disulfide reductase [Acidimicrobiia bacterium]
MRRIVTAVILAVLATACSAPGDVGNVPLLPETNPDALQELLADTERPIVLNVWASWCIPCRSEAPLLRAAHESFGTEVEFIGLNVRDTQDPARAFLNEFRLDGFAHYFDPSGAAQGSLGAGGVPLTLFFAPGGDLVELHYGVIDDRTLALNLDEIVRRGN